MRRIPLVMLSLLIGVGCQAVTPNSKTPRPLSAASPKIKASTAPVAPPIPVVMPTAAPGEQVLPLPPETPRIVTAGGIVELTGKVKLISDRGGSLISNNTGNLVSNNAGNLIGDAGGQFRVLAETASESLLADAQIEVLDAQGHVLVDAQGRPVGGRSDAQGNYTLKVALPDENLIMRVRLFPHNKASSGELRAILAKDSRSGAPALNLDTASSLGTAYVMDKYVQNRQAVFDKLPGKEALTLQQELESARGMLSTRPDYQPQTLVAAVESLRGQAPGVSAQLERIKALLLVGQSNNGNGLQALSVPLISPVMACRNAEGDLLIAETFGRIRRVDADGVISTYAGEPGALGELAQPLQLMDAMIPGPDGSLYIATGMSSVVLKLSPDGRRTVVAGTGTGGKSGVGGPATSAQLSEPRSLALGADGSLYIGEAPEGTTQGGRLLKVDPAGILTQIPTTEPEFVKGQFSGIGVGSDGTLYVCEAEANVFARKKPGAAWEVLRTGVRFGFGSRIWVTAKDEVYFTESVIGNILKFSPDGTFSQVAGTGKAGFSGNGGPATAAQFANPTGLWIGSDGKMLVADGGNGMVRSIDLNSPGHPVTTLAGVSGLSQVGDALAIAINGPGGLAIDPQGRLVFSESGSSTIKRLENGSLTTIAGTTSGKAEAGAAPLDAVFNTPSGIGFDGNALIIADTKNRRIRKINFDLPAPTVDAIALKGGLGPIGAQFMPALETKTNAPLALSVGPNHEVAFTDYGNHSVLLLRSDGQVELVAGDILGVRGDSGDNGPGHMARCYNPLSVAFDAAGDLYIADTGNLRIRKIAMKDAERRITTFAGLSKDQVTTLALSGKPLNVEGGPASQAVMWGPCSLAFDAAGDLYVGELGTIQMTLASAGAQIPTGMLPEVRARIRKIDMKDPTHPIKTIAGEGADLLSDTVGDNQLRVPFVMVFDAEGRLVVADSGLNQLKVLPKGSF